LGWLRWGLPLAALLLLAPIPAVSVLEERDSFCTACHLAPEAAYFNRAQAALAAVEPPADLSSAHYAITTADSAGFRCIDCHRGNGGAAHRAATLALAARDTLTFVAGQADPALEKGRAARPDLLAAGCEKCHMASLLVTGFENHFHNKLPAAHTAWQAGGELTAPASQPEAAQDGLELYDTAVGCLDCHRAHVQAPGGELTGYLDLDNVVLPACVQCHRDTGRGPLELAAP
jgi:hypothetical protein